MGAWRVCKAGVVLVLVLLGACAASMAQITIPLPTKGGTAEEALDFGSVPVGTTKTAQYTLTVLQQSDTSGTVTRIELPAAPFAATSVPALGTVIPPGGSVVVTFAFTPPAVGTYSGTFTIELTGGYPPQTHKKTLYLTGEGVRTTSQPSPSEAVSGPPISWPWGQTEVTRTPTTDVTEDVAKLEAKLDAMETVLREFRQKLDNLAGILGEWIVGRGQRFYIEPGMAGYNPTAPSEGIKLEIENLEKKLDQVLTRVSETVPTEGPPQLPPVQVTANSGNRFRNFLSLADGLLVRTAADVFAINPEDAYTQEILASYSEFVLAGREEVSQLITLSQSIPLETQAVLDSVVVDGAPELLDVLTSGASRTPKYQVQLHAGGNEVVSTVLEKAGMALSSVPILGGLFNAVLDDAAKLFKGNSELAELVSGMALAQLELELKLDAIVRGLFGVSLEDTADETALRERLRQVTLGDIPERFEGLRTEIDELRKKLDNLGWWLGKLTVGYAIGIEPGSTNIMPKTDLWTLLDALEAKLDKGEVKLDDLEQALDDLQQALDGLADWLDDQFSWLDQMFAWLEGEVANAVAGVLAAVNANGDAIAANGDAIAAVKAGVNANNAAIAANANAIANVQAGVNANNAAIAANANAIANVQVGVNGNGMSIAANANAIANVQVGVNANNAAIAANANAIAGVQAGVNASNAAIAANANAIAAMQAQVESNGAAIATLDIMVRNLLASNNRLEDRVNQFLGFPTAPDASKIALRGDALVGEAGAVGANALVTVYGPTGDQTSVTAGRDGSFSVAVPPSAASYGFAEVTQTDAQGHESARVLIYAAS